MGSWFFSYNPSIKWVRIYGGNSPMLGSIFFLTKALMGSVSVCRLILGSGLLHVDSKDTEPRRSKERYK